MDTSTVISAMPNQYETMLANYASIVEKTNNQLGLGINLATLAVAILSVLVALTAIFVAIALWKNSKEQKDMMNQFFSEQGKIIKEKNGNIDKIEKKFDNLIGEYENKLVDVGTANQESKKQIQEAINELKKEKASASAYLVQPSSLQYPMPFATDHPTLLCSQKSMNCFKCGKLFKYRNEYSGLALLSGGKTVHCPYCGASNIEQ